MTNHYFYKLFARDIIYSFTYGKYKYIAFLSIIAFLSLMTSMQQTPIESNSVGVLYSLVKDNGYIHQLSDYQVPFDWIFIQFIVLFLLTDFLSQDLENNCPNLLLRGRSKDKYILSKICWIIVQSIILFVGIFTVVYIVSSLVLGDFSLNTTNYFNDVIASQLHIEITPIQFLLRILIGFVMTTVLLSCSFLLMIQFFAPIISYFGLIVLCAVSTFSDLKWLPAIHSMILKQSIFDMDHHLTLRFSIIYCVVLFVLVSLLTFAIFRRKDIL